MSAIEIGVVTPLTAKLGDEQAQLPDVAELRQDAEGDVEPIGLDSLKSVAMNAEVLEANRIVVDAQNSVAGPAYKILRTRLLQLMRANRWSTLAVTSTAPNEGKTLTAINLSLSFARDVNTTTILADFDLRKPSVAKYLGILPDHDLTDVLAGNVPLEQALVRPGLDRLGLLLNSLSTPNSSEALSSPDVAKVVRRLRAGPDRIVVFDMPPLLAGDDVLAFAPHVDALLIVLSESVTTRESLAAAKELIKGFNVVGTVLNRSTEGSGHNYYGYGYGYGSSN